MIGQPTLAIVSTVIFEQSLSRFQALIEEKLCDRLVKSSEGTKKILENWLEWMCTNYVNQSIHTVSIDYNDYFSISFL